MIIVTTDSVPGQTVQVVYGLVNVSAVQTKSAISDALSGFKSVFGGKLGKYEQMCQIAQQKALEKLTLLAQNMGANAIVGLRFATPNTTETGSAEIVAYGTAVKVG